MNTLSRHSFLYMLNTTPVKVLIPLAIIAAGLIAAAFLSGCAMTAEQSANARATAGLIAGRVASIAGSVIMNSLANQNEGEDFLHSAATGLRTQSLSIVTAEDVRKVIDIWTPERPQWEKLGDKAGEEFERATAAGLAPPVAVEAIAEGMQDAAANEI
jgi:hypothetical protein